MSSRQVNSTELTVRTRFNKRSLRFSQCGLSLVELMIAMTLGLFIISATLSVYLAQTQMYRISVGQALIQNAQNAITAFVTPVIRSAGFTGCNTVNQVLSNLNAGGPPPLGTLNTTPAMLMGYKATTALGADNAANDSNASHWSPTLDSTLVGSVESGSDVIVVLGGMVGTQPVGVTTIASGSSSFIVQSASGVSAGQFGAVSDCIKTSLFKVTSVTGTTIVHDDASGVLNNATEALAINFSTGSQFIPMQQTAFFVAQGHGGQSALMMATLNGTTWTIQPIVPGVQLMLVQYGIGANEVVTQYVGANNVTNWDQVYAIRLGFILEGQLGSNVTQTQFTVLGNTVNIPNDSRLRHVFEMTINLRNATS